MSEHFTKVKGYLLDLDINIVHEDEADELVIVRDEERFIHNLVIDCEAPIVILEQFILDVPADPNQLFKRLLQLNRVLVHGAFVLDEAAEKVIFRDTLQLENLDLNELEASITAITAAMAENAKELIELSKPRS